MGRAATVQAGVRSAAIDASILGLSAEKGEPVVP
jgi:hypothetical protein